MKHPEPETWMTYLYGETSPEETSTLDQHLAECKTCRLQVEMWRETQAWLELDAPQEPVVSRKAVASRSLWAGVPLLKVAALLTFALLTGLLGYVGGQVSLRSAMRAELQSLWQAQRAQSMEALSEHMEHQLDVRWESIRRDQLEWETRWADSQKRLLENQTAAIQRARAEDHTLLLETLQLLETRRVADLEWMLGSLAWLAHGAGQGLEATDSRLTALAQYILTQSDLQESAD